MQLQYIGMERKRKKKKADEDVDERPEAKTV